MLPACVNVEENERFEPAEEEVLDIKGSGNNGVVTREEACFVTRGPRVSVDVWEGGRVKTKVHRTSLNGSKQTSEEVTANNDDAFDQTGSFFFPALTSWYAPHPRPDGRKCRSEVEIPF